MRWRTLLKAILICFPLLVLAGESDKLTLSDCIKIGLKNSYKIKTARFDIISADAKAKEAAINMLPSLSLSGGYVRLSDVPPFAIETSMPPPFPETITVSQTVLDYYNLKLSLHQPLFTGFKLKNFAKMNKLASEAVRFDEEAVKCEVVYNIKRAYWQLHKLKEYRVVFEENVRMLESHKSDAENFVRAGLANKDAILNIESRVATAELLLMKADNNIKLAELALKNCIGLPLEAEIEIADTVDGEFTVDYSLDEARRIALENRSDLHSTKLKLKKAEAGMNMAISGYYPQIFLIGNFYYDRPNQRIMPVKNEFRETWDVSIGVSFDLWNWGKTGYQVQQASSAYKRALELHLQAKEGIILEVTQSYLELEQAVKSIEAASKAVELAEENYRIVYNKYQQGMATNSDLLDAEIELVKVRSDLTGIRTEFWIIKAKLEYCMGIISFN